MKSGIYCIKNKLNNKLYIGSSYNIRNRIKQHFKSLEFGNHHSKYLQRSFKKYGAQNFEHFILEYCEKENLVEREQHYINILSPRYNMSKIAGSTLGMKRSDETKRRLRESHIGKPALNKGIPATQAQKEKQSKKMKGRVSGAKGKKWSKESRDKLSQSRKGMIPSNIVPIFQYTKDGKFIKEYISIKDAERNTKTKGIHQVLKGRCKTANNFIWSKVKMEFLLP